MKVENTMILEHEISDISFTFPLDWAWNVPHPLVKLYTLFEQKSCYIALAISQFGTFTSRRGLCNLHRRRDDVSMNVC